MTQYELADLFASSASRITNVWSLFVAVQVGILGILFFSKRNFSCVGAFCFLFFYSMFTLINGPGLHKAYIYLEVILQELKIKLKENSEELIFLQQHMESLDYSDRYLMIIIIHGIFWLLIAFLTLRKIWVK